MPDSAMSSTSPERSRSIFRFKQFALSNTLSAQRVGTDGVITGAAAPIPDVGAPTVWDVGAGTGLIALMIAQRSPSARIFAVELDAEAAAECRANVAASPWADRVTVVEGDINSCASSLAAPDLIISNPPFFTTDGALAPDSRRRLARFDGSLSPAILLRLAAETLRPGGMLSFIAPSDRNDAILLDAELARLSPVTTLDIASRSDRQPIRRLWTLMRRLEAPGPNTHTRLDIHPADAPATLTPEFHALTSPFYL